MTTFELLVPPDMPLPSGYSHVAVIGPGSRLACTAGQVPVGKDGTPAPPGDWETHTRLAFENVGAALEAGGAPWNSVVKLTY